MSDFQAYIDHGWSLCRIEPGSKGPRREGWNLRENALKSADGVKAAGLLHSYSGTAAFDIDDLAKTTKFLQEHGIDLSDLLLAPDAVQISSGRPNRGKLLYAMSQPLPSKSFAEGAFELRCGTTGGKTSQDVLPPSPHPSGSIYKWIGDWKSLPTIPEGLLSLWRPAELPLLASQAGNGVVNTAEIRDLLSRRDPSCGYEEWLKIGMAIHHATEGSDEGLSLWDDWSARSESKYCGIESIRSHWVSFGRSEVSVTLDSLRRVDVASIDEFAALGQADESDFLAEGENPYKGAWLSVPELAKRPKPTWIIPTILPEAGLGCIWGHSGTGKTFVAVDIASAVATGREWRGQPTKQGKVLYVAAEDDGGVQVRFEAMYAAYGIPDAPVSVLPLSPSFTSAKDTTWFIDSIKDFGKISLIFVDTMAAVTPGADENSSKDMNLLIRFCKKLHKATGALVVLIHHANRTGTIRGSSALHAAFDAEWEVTDEERDRVMWPRKLKNAPIKNAYRFTLSPVDETCIVQWMDNIFEDKRF